MIEKRAEYFYGDNNSEVFTLIGKGTMEKTASYSEELVDYINSLKKRVDKVYALVNALSAGEFYSSNRNGDHFPEKALKQYHKTFEALGHVYRHHVNKDPRKSLGKVLFSHYNPTMHRVELILELDSKKGADVITKMQKGELPFCSMGTKVPFDICSICGNKAQTRAQYCDHLKYRMNNILSDGRKVYAINTMPKFFDISVVTIPADRTASFIRLLEAKSSSRPRVIKIAEELPKETKQLFKAAGFEPRAEIRKKVDVKIEIADQDPKNILLHTQKRLSDETIEKLSKYNIDEILSTMMALRIAPVREDFQKLAAYVFGQKEAADKWAENGVCFIVDKDTVPTELPNVTFDNFNSKIAGVLLKSVPDMSLTKQWVLARGIHKVGYESQATTYPSNVSRERSGIKRFLFTQKEEPPVSAHRNPVVPLGLLGSLYYGYAKVFNNPSINKFRSFVVKYPWLLPVLVGAGTAGSLASQSVAFNKEASLGAVDKFLMSSLITVPTAYYYAGKQENKARKGVPLKPTENFARKHPLLAGLVGATVATAIKRPKFFKTAELLSEISPEDLDLLYKDIIGGQ